MTLLESPDGWTLRPGSGSCAPDQLTMDGELGTTEPETYRLTAFDRDTIAGPFTRCSRNGRIERYNAEGQTQRRSEPGAADPWAQPDFGGMRRSPQARFRKVARSFKVHCTAGCLALRQHRQMNVSGPGPQDRGAQVDAARGRTGSKLEWRCGRGPGCCLDIQVKWSRGAEESRRYQRGCPMPRGTRAGAIRKRFQSSETSQTRAAGEAVPVATEAGSVRACGHLISARAQATATDCGGHSDRRAVANASPMRAIRGRYDQRGEGKEAAGGVGDIREWHDARGRSLRIQ